MSGLEREQKELETGLGRLEEQIGKVTKAISSGDGALGAEAAKLTAQIEEYKQQAKAVGANLQKVIVTAVRTAGIPVPTSWL